MSKSDTREKRPLTALVATLLLIQIVLAAGCGPQPAAPTPTLEPTAIPGMINTAAGQEFPITLESNRTTGYQWQLAKPLDEAILKLVGSEYRTPESKPGLVGAGGQEVWTFKAVGKGRTEISLKYVRPWEKDGKPAKEQSYTIVVR